MKAEWQVKTLGEVCKTSSGGTPLKSKREYYADGNIPWLMSGEVSQGEIHHSQTFISQKGLENSSAKLFPINTVLVAMYGATAGQVGILKFEAATNQAVCGIFPTKEFLPEFLYYQFLSKKEELIGQATGNAQPNISQAKIRNTEVGIPPLAEQKRIVSILDEAFEGIATAKANAEQNLAKCDAIFESQLSSVFNQSAVIWPSKKIKDISKHSLGKMLDKAKNKGDFHPYLRNFNVRWFDFDLSDISEMPFLPEENEKYTAIKGDVLICEGGYPGRAAIWNLDYPIHFQKALHRVRFHDKSHSKWFLYYLYHQDKSGELKSHFNGAGIQHFTGESLAKFELPLPPNAEIEKAVGMFEELLEESRKLADVYRRKLVALDELKKSLLHKAFAGEL